MWGEISPIEGRTRDHDFHTPTDRVLEVFGTRMTFTDGTPDAHEGGHAELLYIDSDEATLEYAQAILAVVAELRS